MTFPEVAIYRLYDPKRVPKQLCLETVRSRSGYVPKRSCPETAMSRGGYVPKWSCPEVAMSRNGHVPKWLCPETVVSRSDRHSRESCHSFSHCQPTQRPNNRTTIYRRQNMLSQSTLHAPSLAFCIYATVNNLTRVTVKLLHRFKFKFLKFHRKWRLLNGDENLVRMRVF